ncbi:MAG: putative DNA binding domain-containing protein [Roseburia sp.]|nr:putative DNA binding domain-containing protein [Roseburia sp.]
MDLEKIVRELINYPREANWFEFKENWYEPNGLGEYISSLSNVAALEGQAFGYLIWGVNNDTHELTGTKFDYTVDVKNEPLEHFLARQIVPDNNFSFHELTLDGKRIVVMVVPAASKIPTSFDGNRYLRIGSSKVNLNKYPERESNLFYILRVGLPTINNTESEYQDLTFEKLFVYYASKGITLNKRTFKKNMGLLTETGKYNLLAQLLSDNSYIPIRFAIFNGTDKASTMYSVREFGNTCLLLSLDKVLEYGDVLNVPQADERNRKVERKEISLFDADAFREAIINAFVHNLWISGNAPMITVFSDRIEILSRGTIPPGQTMEGFFAGESVPVNQKLSDIFLQLHISERTGRGVPKITEAYGRETYEFRENSIVVSIPFTRVSTEENTPVTTPVSTPVSTPVESLFEDNSQTKRILEFCTSPKGILEIADMLGYTQKKSVRKYLKPLVEQGRLAMTIPDRPNSSSQKYVTVR